jgi:hypothetical protein
MSGRPGRIKRVFDVGVSLEELAQLPPGAELAEVLARVDRSVLNGYELIEVAKAHSRQVAHYQAELLAAAWESAYCPPGDEASPPARTDTPDEHAAEEVRWALILTRRAADTLLGVAYQLVECLPAVHAALRAGVIDLPKARVLADETAALPQPIARRLVEAVLPAAGGLTTGQLRARLRKWVITVDPDAASRRQREAVTGRRVEHGLDPDGTATLAGYHLPADRAATAAARIDALARAAKHAGDPRTLDQLRADVYLDVLNGDHTADPSVGGGGVEIMVPLTTLMGLTDEPGQVNGWGPVIAEISRKLVDRQRDRPWRFSVYDEDGALVEHGPLRRRPSARDAAFVKARDRTCRAPGCRTPAHRSDLDHTIAWEHGGPTVPANLGVLCRHCHGYKHSNGVQLTQPTPGTFVWRTRLGHTYTTRPEPP